MGQNISASAVALEYLHCGGSGLGVAANWLTKQGTRDHIHRQMAEQVVHRNLASVHIGHTLINRLQHQAGVASHLLGREGLHQKSPLAVPHGSFRHKHRLPNKFSKHLGGALPTDQGIGMVDHQLAQQLWVEDIDGALVQDA